MSKRKAGYAGLAGVFCGLAAGLVYWITKHTEPERYVCAVHMTEWLHPEIDRPLCTKEEAARRQAYYGTSNIFPHGVYTSDTPPAKRP